MVRRKRGQQQHHRVVGDFLDERVGAVGHRDAALGGSLHVDAVHADAAQDDAATPLRQAVDDLLGDADALRIDGIGILGELDEPVLVGRAFDDLGVDAFQRLHLQVVAAAGDGEAGPGGRRDLELGHSVSFSSLSAMSGHDGSRFHPFGGRARTAFSFTSMPQPGPFGNTNSPFSIVGTVT